MSGAFSISTMLIAVPSAIKVFNWLGSVYGGSIRFTTPMLFALAFVSMFIIGGLSGIFMASTTVDLFIHHTYIVVAHFHYVLFGGSILAAFAGIYTWFPKMFGRMMNDTWGRVHFGLTFFFFNCLFFPMHNLGIGGMMRRIADPTVYEHLQNLQPINQFVTISAFMLGLSQVVFFINFFHSMFHGKKAERNPWNATTLEWTCPSPPGHGNFEGALPTVHHGPYEYSVPSMKEDFLPQNQAHAEVETIDGKPLKLSLTH
jgi:cytochrome c oxidase subunit 1